MGITWESYLTTPWVFLNTEAAKLCVTPTRLVPSTSTIWSFTLILEDRKVGEQVKKCLYTWPKYSSLNPELSPSLSAESFIITGLFCYTHGSNKETKIWIDMKFKQIHLNLTRRISENWIINCNLYKMQVHKLGICFITL